MDSALVRLAAHLDGRVTVAVEGSPPSPTPSVKLAAITASWADDTSLYEPTAEPLKEWLESTVALIDESNEREEQRLTALLSQVQISSLQNKAVAVLKDRIPVFVLFSNYFRVRPIIHLAHLATRLQSGVLDDDQYDYGNSCLLKLLGFTAKGLSDLGNAPEPPPDQPQALEAYRDQLDRRTYQLNAGERVGVRGRHRRINRFGIRSNGSPRFPAPREKFPAPVQKIPCHGAKIPCEAAKNSLPGATNAAIGAVESNRANGLPRSCRTDARFFPCHQGIFCRRGG